MQLLGALTEQLKGLWSRWSIAQRIGISAAASACLTIVAGTLLWATRTEYVVIANHLTPAQAAEIVGLLDTEQIAAKMNFSGSAVSVSRSDVGAARLALKDYSGELPASDGADAMTGVFESPRDQSDRRRRSLEQRLAKSVAMIRGIRTATVLLSQPEKSPFVDEIAPVTASIVIDPIPNGGFTTGTAQSIVLLVSGAVEGLLPANVSLTDTSGRQYLAKQGLDAAIGTQFELKQREEQYLADKAQSMLVPLLGVGRAVVRVTLDMDFRETTSIKQTFDPDTKVKRTETIETEKTSGGSRIAQGPAGTASNVAPTDPGTQQGSSTKEMIQTDYDNSSTNETVRDLPGRITRLTVAAIVDVPDPNAGAAATTGAAGSDPATAPAAPATAAIDMTTIEGIIKQAVGFDRSRNDEIQILHAPLTHAPLFEDVPLVPPFWQQYESLIQSASLALAGLLAFVMGLLVLRKMKPVVVGSPQEEPMSLADMIRLQTISEQAKAHPELVATILKSWLGETEDSPAVPVAETSKAPVRPQSAPSAPSIAGRVPGVTSNVSSETQRRAA